MSDSRQQELQSWTLEALGRGAPEPASAAVLQAVSGDASFRRYFRIALGDESRIVVDAPPEKEDCRTFVRIGSLLLEAGLRAPRVFAVDYERGFMLIEDFGDQLYLDHLLRLQRQGREAAVDALYQTAISCLLDMQARVDPASLDPYSREQLHREMALFEDWFCGPLLGLTLTDDERRLIASTLAFLEDAALAQPRVAVHLDYHSRNLMVLDGPDSQPGIIDFQGAVCGACTYDLVSLLRDAYIRLPQPRVEALALHYLEQARMRGIIESLSRAQFLRDFDLMGLQRQLKVIGIFARLAIRDNKPGYLADIPLVMRYFLATARHYREMDAFLDWFGRVVLPVARTRLRLDF